MLFHSRRSAWTLACALLCAGSASFASSSPGIPGSSCEELKLWASSYSRAAPTLDEFSRFDRGQRVAIFNAVSSEARAALWQEQFERFAERSDLSDIQRSLLSEAQSLAVAALYRKETHAQATVRAFWDRAKTVFVRQEHQRAFFELGVVVRDVPPARAATRSDDDYCECNIFREMPQCMGTSCSSASCISFLGCGPFGGDTCNGMCDW